jgi:post-segregation antitoxin (ccd killing protein)
MENTEEKKHWKTIEKEEKEKLALAENPKETEVKEATIPISQVEAMMARLKEDILANLPTQQPKKAEEKMAYKPLNVQEENFDEIPGLEDFEIKDRMYVLCNNAKPLTQGIKNRSRPNSPLTYLNPRTKKTHSLRYSINQVSFFEDQQSGDVRVTTILTRDGMLKTTRDEIPLQKFLSIHPDNVVNGGSVFEEYDPVKEASIDLEKEDKLYEAQTLVRSINELKKDAIARLMCSDYNESWSSAELKRSLFSAVVKSPEKFLTLVNDTSLEVKGISKTALARGVISYSNYKWYNENKEVIAEVSRNEDEFDAIATYLLSGKGLSYYEFLKNAIG